MTKKTYLYSDHIQCSAKLCPFAGYEMPLHYGSQVKEHMAVRENAGLFDVSHMGIVDVEGTQAKDFLRRLLANDIKKLHPNKALYSCMLNDNGGVLDDLIVYCLKDDHYLLVINAATKEKDLSWIEKQAGDSRLSVRDDWGILALQGPKSHIFLDVVNSLKPFSFTEIDGALIAKTGYTGAGGVEILAENKVIKKYWDRFISQGVQPCGLASRDSLRIEAGFNLYGSDMDETVTPYESNLSWTVDFSDENRHFIGRKALEEKEPESQLIGLVLEKGGVLRPGMRCFVDGKEGVITSGTFSPLLNKSVAFARVPKGAYSSGEVEIRGKRVAVTISKCSFIK